jgi:bacillithiol biosynthesis cysteine-adding enzyme BshC
MQLDKIALRDTHAFSDFFLDFVEQKKELREFYHRFASVQNLQEQITEKGKSFSTAQRQTLNESLTKQYEGLVISEQVQANLAALKNENTFTITTGHQLNIFTGPLYFIYKIATVVNACRKMKEASPDKNFVPVYWMASEDHDYDEIKYFRLYGKKYTWETDQRGAVGRFSTTGLPQLAKELPGDVSIFIDAYSKGKTLADATRRYVNALFGAYGVVVVDGDDSRLKSSFQSVIREDIFKHTPKKLVEEKNQKLNKLGYSTQVFARDINFFYLADQLRSRIEKKGEEFHVLDSSTRFTANEMEKEITEHPERFSPNVILRPLYQETILPNLAYVGGPAEMIYWLQLKGIFDHSQIPFPILLPRNFGTVAEAPVMRKFGKTGLELKDLFQEKNFLFNHWVLKNTTHNLTLGKELKEVDSLFEDIQKRAVAIDASLGSLVGAEGKRAQHSLEKIEKKLLKAEKRVHAEKLKQIESVKDALFPNGGLQERVDNFLNFYQQDPAFISNVVERFDPFDFRMHFFQYHD